MTNKLSQVKIGGFPQTSLAIARIKLQELKLIRSEGRCPASVLTVEGLVVLYLTERIEDRKSADGKIIPGARKKKGKKEVRRALENDAVAKSGARVAAEIIRKDIVDRVNGVIERGAKV